MLMGLDSKKTHFLYICVAFSLSFSAVLNFVTKNLCDGVEFSYMTQWPSKDYCALSLSGCNILKSE